MEVLETGDTGKRSPSPPLLHREAGIGQVASVAAAIVVGDATAP